MTEPTATNNRQGGLRFLLSRRWLGYFALLVVFAIICGFLSAWQFDRRDEKVEANELVANNYDAEPLPVAEVLPELSSFDDATEWQPVLLEGEYLVDEQLLARARPKDGRPGFEILTPFRTEDGNIFIVNRGWIPTGETQDYPDAVPMAPTGRATVTARLRPSEQEIPGRTAPEGQIATIHLPTFAANLGEDRVYTGAYGFLRTESPSAETGSLFERPEVTEGNHLSYAFQWIIFAIIALVGLIYGVRGEFRDRNPDDPRVIAAQEREQAREAERKRRGKLTDAEIEDAEIEDAGVDERPLEASR